MSHQQQQQQPPYRGGGGGRGGGRQPGGGRGQPHPGAGGYPAYAPPGGPPPGPWAYQQQQQQRPPQYQPVPAQYGYNPYGYYMPQPSGGPPRYGGPPDSSAAGRGVYYPPASSTATTNPSVQANPDVARPAPQDKFGNPLTFARPAAKAAAPVAAAAAPAVAAPAAAAPSLSAEEAGEKLRQAVLERLEANQNKKADTKPAEPAKTNGTAAAVKPPEPKAAPEPKAPAPKAPEPTKEPEKKETKEVAAPVEAVRPQPPAKKKSIAAVLKETADKPVSEKKRSTGVYSKEDLIGLKELPPCLVRPAELPVRVIERREEQRDHGNRRGGDNRRGDRRGSQKDGDQWARGAPARRQNSQGGNNNNNGGPEWGRNQELPRQQSKGNRRTSGRGGHHQQPPLFDGPVAPLVKSDNHWKPKKNASAFVVSEKKVKSILNKMTKEKFDRLSSQMLEIPILSYETLTMMIDNVYDKAIDEPTFGDMYADLCVRLSQSVKGNEFVHVIESDEEPPTDDGETPSPDSNDSSSHVVYRWSNDVSTSDSEVIGPLASAEACIEAALTDSDATPQDRADMEMELVSVSIRHGRFIKIMKKKVKAEGEEDSYYVVFFPAAEAQDCGQQLSEIFLSEVECQADAAKKNSFKRSLLNKCQEEFNKQDIYVDWKKDKTEYEASKTTMSETEQAEKEEELNFRRIRIKKQMLGNVKFIGQLYKKGLIKEKIMRFCIGSTLKLEERDDVKSKVPEYNIGDYADMDEEDHEAICSMFSTIGTTIDMLPAANFMAVCFTKIGELSQSKDLPVRSKFMYRDLIDLRSNNWVPRRKEEKAKTIAEIRKDVEREERAQANPGRGGRGGDYRSGGRGNRGSVTSGSSMRARAAKPVAKTDDDGFTQIVSGRTAAVPAKSSRMQPRSDIRETAPAAKKSNFAALANDGSKQNGAAKQTSKDSSVPALTKDQLKRKVKSMRNDFMNDGGNVDELLLTWQEMSGTDGAGADLVSTNVDHMMEAKDSERFAIYKILKVLSEREKLTKVDVQEGLADPLEFIDSAVMDCPRAHEYFGDIMADMLRMKMIDIPWLCEQFEKIVAGDDATKAPESITRHLLRSVKENEGIDAAKLHASNSTLKERLGASLVDEILGSL